MSKASKANKSIKLPKSVKKQLAIMSKKPAHSNSIFANEDFDIVLALHMRINERRSYEDIAACFNISGPGVRHALKRHFGDAVDLGKASVSELNETMVKVKKTQMLLAMKDQKIEEAPLRDLTSGFKALNEADRLNDNKSTSNVGIAAFLQSMDDKKSVEFDEGELG